MNVANSRSILYGLKKKLESRKKLKFCKANLIFKKRIIQNKAFYIIFSLKNNFGKWMKANCMIFYKKKIYFFNISYIRFDKQTVL